MSKELELLNWMIERLPKVSSYKTKTVESLVIGDVYAFVAYADNGLDIIHLYGGDAQIAESICEYLRIPLRAS